VLKQLVAWVGIDAFFAGVAAYFKKNAYGNTELGDLLTELEATSGRDLSGWSALWLETAGVNTLRPEIETTADGTIKAFAVLQSAAPDYPTIRPHRLAIGFYSLEGTKLVRTERFEIDVAGERTDVASLVGYKKPDLLLINDDDLAYAKIRLDADSLAVAIEHLADIESPLARAIVWGSVWDSTRDGETAARDYVRLVLGNIATETESTTIRTTLGQLTTVARLYVEPSTRAATIARVGDALWELATSAEAGSDAQFQFVKFFANIASTAEHVATLSGLRDGSVALPELAIDTDLGWEILEGLALNGAVGDAEIDAALAADNTSNGQQAAARTRAAIATPEGKLAAFASVVSTDELPNAIVRQTAVGFQHVNDPAVLAGLVDDYFEMLTEIWKSRTHSIAETLVVGLYPTPLASAELVAATRAWLAANPDTPALRRLVIENLAGVERALVVQERDAR